MSNEFVQLSQLADILGGFAFKSHDLGDVGHPVVKITNIEPPNVTLHGSQRVLPQVVVGLERFKLRNRDIVMAMTGATTGKVGRLRSSETSYLNQRVAKLSAKLGPDFDDFIYAVVSQPGFDIRVMNNAHGSAQPNVSADGIGRILVPRFHPDEQLAIGRCIGALDDKIESNHCTSRMQERVARGIFRAWFVDFEPVKAKAAGAHLYPGMPQNAFDALPTRLAESELGPVPDGWGVGRIGDVVGMRMDRTDPSEETVRLPYVPIECISPKSLSLQDWKHGSEAQSSLQRFYRGDILFGAMRPYFHKVCLAPFDGTTRTTAFVLVPKKSKHSAHAALLVHDPSTVNYATQHSVGSTIPYAKWERSLANMPVVVPPATQLECFEEIVRPLLDPLMHASFENARLREMRDYLLPKLLNRLVRVPDIGDIAGEVSVV